MTTTNLLGRFRHMLASGDYAIVAELYTDDALFDINVPEWRFQLSGPERIQRQLDEWHPQPPELVEWQERLSSWGAVVELALWEGDNNELYSRSIHMFDIIDGAIARHTMYCTGDWTKQALDRATAALIAPSSSTV